MLGNTGLKGKVTVMHVSKCFTFHGYLQEEQKNTL